MRNSANGAIQGQRSVPEVPRYKRQPDPAWEHTAGWHLAPPQATLGAFYTYFGKITRPITASGDEDDAGRVAQHTLLSAPRSYKAAGHALDTHPLDPGGRNLTTSCTSPIIQGSIRPGAAALDSGGT